MQNLAAVGTPDPGVSASAPLRKIAVKNWLETKTEPNSIEKVTGWQNMSVAPWLQHTCGGGRAGLGMGLGRGRTPSYEALKGAVTDLYRLDDFVSETLGAGFFSDVYKVTHKSSGRVLVLKMNKHKSNRNNMLKEIQLMNKLKHPNILRFEAVCVHEGQLHALTEYIAGGNLEQLIGDMDFDLPWVNRMEISLHIAKGLMYLNSQGMFHRDLTSKNILIKKEAKLTAIIGDFGLATRIPKKDEPRLPQVGSPYWMSPECLRGEYYDHQADIFSFGIILCELIARCNADPDILPRTQNFGVDYIAFSEMCPTCPPAYLKIAYTCVSIEPSVRPKSNELVSQLKTMIEHQKQEDRTALNEEHSQRFVTLKRFMSEGEYSVKKSPSEKARLHTINQQQHHTCWQQQHHTSTQQHHPIVTVKSVGEEMCLLDPYYTPRNSVCVNPFATLPRLREGRKLIGSTVDLFSSCFELPSPRVSSPTDLHPAPCRSLPSSPPNSHRNINPGAQELPISLSPIRHPSDNTIPGQNRVNILKKMYSSRGFMSQDDSALGLYSDVAPTNPLPLKRWGSVESGIYSVSEDWFSGPISSRSICSSLLTVSDLEEDLRAASAFLSKKRTSSVFTDSIDDLSSRLDDISNTGTKCDSRPDERGYEKDIRDIVEYFERNCRAKDRNSTGNDCVDSRTSPEIARSQKIESLIKRVAENKNRARLRRHSPQQNLQVCDGIVRSKLQIFDQKRRQPRPRFDQSGFVKSRRAIFDATPTKPGSGRKLVGDMLRQRQESKLTKLIESRSRESGQQGWG